MHKFFFNSECLPKHNNLIEFRGLFSETLRAYHHLVTKGNEDTIDKKGILKISAGIITEKIPSELNLGKDYSLNTVIDTIEDKELKTLAYSYFLKYPIDSHLNNIEEDCEKMLDAEYTVSIGDTSFPILYLAFVASNSSFAFTVPLHNDLKKDYLVLKSTTACDLSLDNLFDNSTTNIAYIIQRIKVLNSQSLSLFEKLLDLLNQPRYEKNFEKSFEKLSIKEQESIVRKFEDSIKQDSITYPDDNTVKNVTPSKSKCTVFELRVFSPTALRVYFNTTEEIVYLGSIEHKSNSDQNSDIKKAHDILYNLISNS